MKMKPLLFLLALAVLPVAKGRAQAVIEGRVELPKTHTAPVMTKR